MFHISSRQIYGKIFATLGLLAFMTILFSVCFTFTGKVIRMSFNNIEPEVETQLIIKKPLPGHWLKTTENTFESGQQNKLNITGPAESVNLATCGNIQNGNSLDKIKSGRETQEERMLKNEMLRKGAASVRHLNKKADLENVLYIWTDNAKLRVVSIMTLNKSTKRPAIVVIPLRTILTKDGQTLQQVFRTQGREGLRREIAEKIETKLHNYVHIDQEALYGFSEILGTLEVEGETITMARALEESAAGLRTNDSGIVKAVAKQTIKPATLFKLPTLVQILTEHVETSFSISEIIQLINFSRGLDMDEIEKVLLPGKEILYGGQVLRIVSQDTWQDILYEATK